MVKRVRAILRIQARTRGRMVRQKGALVEPEALLDTVRQLRKEQSGFRGLVRQATVLACFVMVLALQRDVAGARDMENVLRRAVLRVAAQTPATVGDAMAWCEAAFEAWYSFDEGLNAVDISEYRRNVLGISGGYEAAIQDCAPVITTDKACQAPLTSLVHEAASGEGDVDAATQRAKEPEPEPDEEPPPKLEATSVEKASSDVGGGPDGTALEPVADPEPQVSVASGQSSLQPDACKRVALHEQERRRLMACGSTIYSNRSAGGFLGEGLTRFIGAMLITQTRRTPSVCHGLTTAERRLHQECYTQMAHAVPIPPYDQFWHFHNEEAGGYLLPLDLGIWAVPKDSGRCALQLARAANWTGRATQELWVETATFNAELRRVGAVRVIFTVDAAGDVSMNVDIASARPAVASYRLEPPLSALPLVELCYLCILLMLDVRPLLHKTRAVGFASALFHAPRPELCLGWSNLLAVLSLVVIQVYRVVESTLHFEEAISMPTRDIRDHPQDFRLVLSSLRWVRRDALMVRWHGYAGLVVLLLSTCRILLATRFHPRMSVLVDTLSSALASLQSLFVIYLLCLLLFAAGGHTLFGHAVPAFGTFGSALNAVWLLSLGELQPLASDMARVDPTVGVLYFVLMILTLVFVLLNILLSVVMEIYTSAVERSKDAVCANNAPSFMVGCAFALVSSRHQLVRAAETLKGMPRRPCLKMEAKRRMQDAGVSALTIFAIFTAKHTDDSEEATTDPFRATVLEKLKATQPKRLLRGLTTHIGIGASSDARLSRGSQRNSSSSPAVSSDP